MDNCFPPNFNQGGFAPPMQGFPPGMDNSQVAPQNAPPTGNVNQNTKQVLSSSLQGSALDSKKWLAMMVGLACVMLIVSAAMILVATTDPIKSTSYVSLANMAIVFTGMMVSVLLTGQSAVEWRTSSALSDMHTAEVRAAVDTQNQNVNQTYTKVIQVPYTKDMDARIKAESDEAAPEIKPFSSPAQTNYAPPTPGAPGMPPGMSN